MKSHTIQWNSSPAGHALPKPVIRKAYALDLAGVVAILTAVIIATAIVVLAMWAAGHNGQDALGALGWMAGIVFLALAIDSRDPLSILQLVTGISLMLLAWASSRISPEFGVISGLIIAAWVVAPLSSRINQRSPGSLSDLT